jgi:hypothetical protein
MSVVRKRMRLSYPAKVVMKPLYAWNIGYGSTGYYTCCFGITVKSRGKNWERVYEFVVGKRVQKVLTYTALHRQVTECMVHYELVRDSLCIVPVPYRGECDGCDLSLRVSQRT